MLVFTRMRSTGKVCYQPNNFMGIGFLTRTTAPLHPKYVNFSQTYLGMGTRISVPSTSGFRFIPLSLIALIAAAVH